VKVNIMAKMVLGVFADRINAEDAIMSLEDHGYNPKDISIIMKDRAASQEIANNTGASVAEGAVTGATAGGILGALAGLLVGIGAITIPGVGALFIAGPIATALGITGAAGATVSGALTGALAGGLVGGLMGLGVPEEDARLYEDRIRAGAILVAVPTVDLREEEVKSILDGFGAEQVRSVAYLREEAPLRREDRRKVEDYEPAYAHDIHEDVVESDAKEDRGWFGDTVRKFRAPRRR
jgi:hypothetical protein